MKIFAIKNDYEDIDPTAFLIYYELSRKFYIEIIDNADEWEVPFFLSGFVRNGVYTINSRFSYNWVRQRIIPSDRQNIGQIIRDNHLDNYNEYKLLMLGNGRCAQDDYYLQEISESNLPDCITKRFKKRIDDIIPLATSLSLLVFFNDNKVKICKPDSFINNNPKLKRFLSQHPERFDSVKVDIGGYGVTWNDTIFISDTELYNCGKSVPMTKEDVADFMSSRILNTAEAAEILGCSRQNIDDLIKRKKITPVKTTAKDKLFFKNDILKREWI